MLLRTALLFTHEIQAPERAVASHPCAACAEQPCLHACPVGAFSATGYDVAACTTHLHAAAGESCMSRGCLARRACPVGRAYRYSEAQARFHMTAFRAATSPAR